MTRSLLALALLSAATIASPARAEVPLGTVAGSDVAFEGMFQVDGNWFDTDRADLDGRADGRDRATGIRRFELVLKGSGPGGFGWVVGYDVENESYLDNNLSWRFGGDGAPSHTLVLGQAKQPSGLEELSSSRNNDFIAKAAATNTFALGRRLGASWAYDASDYGATVAWFGRELTSDGAHGAGYGARGWWAPLRTDGQVLHLGLSHVDRDTPDDSLRLRARPNADLSAVRLVDSGTLPDADRVATTGLEAMWITGPVKLQGEYFLARADRIGTSGYDAGGGYASAMWNPGGTSWGYRGGLPRTSVGDGGLWQLGLRYDQLDLDDGGVRGGRMDAWTVGVNWYWRSNAKLMLNYVDVASRRTDAASGLRIHDDPSIVEARVQLHW
ncbi:porin [Luteimonas sp. MC1828]|uniref:OprO/OprP family phosphate-selective porin n=1 Tax=Luteimonas sp. MC1828 TaxID=2799787 RepID=UPI0018F26B91|nr:porin [Luteimonas sp. MC1828]MBJ7574612.1 porin [Luteimonas sp. MC1828]